MDLSKKENIVNPKDDSTMSPKEDAKKHECNVSKDEDPTIENKESTTNQEEGSNERDDLDDELDEIVEDFKQARAAVKKHMILIKKDIHTAKEKFIHLKEDSFVDKMTNIEGFLDAFVGRMLDGLLHENELFLPHLYKTIKPPSNSKNNCCSDAIVIKYVILRI